MAGGRVWPGGGGFLGAEGARSLEQGLADGDFKFTLDGARLHGSWVHVRLKHDRAGGKRPSWLLIKHRDDQAKDDDNDALLAEDRSVASGRTMAAIAAGKGKGPTPFMIPAAGKGDPGAVWDSRPAATAEKAAAGKAQRVAKRA